jgi:hypothetical protein
VKRVLGHGSFEVRESADAFVVLVSYLDLCHQVSHAFLPLLQSLQVQDRLGNPFPKQAFTRIRTASVHVGEQATLLLHLGLQINAEDLQALESLRVKHQVV